MCTNSNILNDDFILSDVEKDLQDAIYNIDIKYQEILEKIDEYNSNNTTNYKKSECENRLINIFHYYVAIDNCITSIEQAMVFIRDYDLNKYRGKVNFQINDICRYHYDVICHKVFTINDLYFKLLNELYNLKLKKCNWDNIKKHKGNINNDALIAALEYNYLTTLPIKSARCESSHEGRITSKELSKSEPYFIGVSLQVMCPNIPNKDKEHSPDSFNYGLNTMMMKQKILGDIEKIRNIVINNRKTLLIALAFDLLKFYKDSFPKDTIYKGKDSSMEYIYHANCPINYFDYCNSEDFKP